MLPKIDPVMMNLEQRFKKLLGYQEQTLEQLQERLDNLKKPHSSGSSSST